MVQRHILLLCALSAFVGAWVALYATADPGPQSVSVAQEPGSPTTPDRKRCQDPFFDEVFLSQHATQLPPSHQKTGPDTFSDLAGLTEEEKVHIRVYETVNRSVVNISTKGVQSDGFFMFDVPSEGAGSGVVIDKQGRVVTNYHVIEGARQIQVTLFDSKSYDAKILGVDRNTDVAVLEIDAPGESLFPVRFGDSASLLVGQRVYAIGNPFGLERTLSTGIIASLNRRLPSPRRYRRMEQMIQIDADINPGNSGGPLLDTAGRMIGMNQAIASKTQESAGIGFTIPINTITRVVPQLIEKGRIVRANIGIESVSQMDQGLMVLQLARGGAAERAGLKGPKLERRQYSRGGMVWEQTVVNRSAADVIVGVNGGQIATVEQLLAAVERRKPGEQITVTVVREGHQVDVPIVLDADE